MKGCADSSRVPTKIVAVISGLLFCLLPPGASVAQDSYPDAPITVVVAFGIGGSVDRMARTMSTYLAEELGEPVSVINRMGAGTLLGANYVLNRPHDGYTVFASAFSPYLSNTILEGNADYSIDDFAYLNFQWFDEDLIALNKDSRFIGMEDLLATIRDQPGAVRASVVRGSAGHLMAKVLLEISGIPQRNLNLVTYNNGGAARAAVAGGVVDFIIISALGTESIREYLRPLAIVSEQRHPNWDVPLLNDVLAPLGVTAPILPGSIRGYATSAEFKRRYPERFDTLAAAIERALANPELQELLERTEIDYRWTGPASSTEVMHTNFETFRNYAYLLEL